MWLFTGAPNGMLTHVYEVMVYLTSRGCFVLYISKWKAFNASFEQDTCIAYILKTTVNLGDKPRVHFHYTN